MSRAKAISRSEVQQRSSGEEQFASPLADRWWTPTLIETSFNDLPAGLRMTAKRPALIEELVDIAGAASLESKAQLKRKLTTTVEAYRARVLADQQERPARIVAALEPVLRSARDLSARLNSLPVGLHQELRAGGLEEQLEAIILKADDRLAYWRQHVAAHRLTGEDAANLALRLSLTDIYNEHCLSLRLRKNPKERQRQLNDLVAQACAKIGARHPNEKEHPQRFEGKQKLPSKPGPRQYLRPLSKSEAERPPLGPDPAQAPPWDPPRDSEAAQAAFQAYVPPSALEDLSPAPPWVPYAQRAIDHQRHSREGLMLYVALVIDERLNGLEAQTRLERELRDVLI